MYTLIFVIRAALFPFSGKRVVLGAVELFDLPLP